MLQPMALQMLGARRSGTEESVENSLSDRLCADQEGRKVAFTDDDPCRDIDGNLIEIAVYPESVSGYRAGRLITMASWLLRAITTSAVVSGSGFSSRCGRYGGMKT